MMNDKETSILELVNLLKIVEPTLKKEGKTMMHVDSFGSKKSSKNKKKRKSPRKREGQPRRRLRRLP